MSSGKASEDNVVWLVNKGGHDYTSLEKWGRVIPMTTGAINPFSPDRLMVSLGHHISMAKQGDHIAISGLPIVNMLVLVLWLEKFPEARLLQWSIRSDRYVYTVIKKAAVLRNLKDGERML